MLGFKGEQRGGRIPGGCSSLANVEGPTKTRVSADLEEGVNAGWRREAAPAGCGWREGHRLDMVGEGGAAGRSGGGRRRHPVLHGQPPPSSEGREGRSCSGGGGGGLTGGGGGGRRDGGREEGEATGDGRGLGRWRRRKRGEGRGTDRGGGGGRGPELRSPWDLIIFSGPGTLYV